MLDTFVDFLWLLNHHKPWVHFGTSIIQKTELNIPGCRNKMLFLPGATVAKIFSPEDVPFLPSNPSPLVLGLPKLVWKCVDSHSYSG